MNYREFTERVYNYKHGLTNSAESQNIEHSAKQTEEINENEHIEHSGQGQTWDQHKYIRKEYLGNGNWRYIYEDGSSNVTNAANEKEADVKEGAYQMNKAYGNGAPQNTKTISDTAKKLMTPRGQSSPAGTEFTQARKDMYKELGERAADYNKQLENFQGTAKGLAQSNADQEAAKLKVQAGNIANNLGASQKETEDRKMYVDLANKARDYNSQLEGFQGVVKGLEKSNADQAESARQLEKEALASKAQARSDRFDKMANLDVNTGATPLNQLTNQGTTATTEANKAIEKNNTLDAMNAYKEGINAVREKLASIGKQSPEINELIKSAELTYMDDSIIDAIDAYDGNKQNIVFFPGAEQAFNDYSAKVLPVLNKIADDAIAKQKYDSAVSKLTPEELQAIINEVSNSTGNVTTWDNVPTQTWDNSYNDFNNTLLKENGMSKPDSSYTYVVEKGYDPNHLSPNDVKELFGKETTDNDIYEYSIDSLGMLHYKKKSWQNK